MNAIDSTETPPHAPGEEHHPGPVEFVKVAIFLAIVTAAEVGLYYLKSLSSGVVFTFLMVFMVIKFFTVGSYFMHLKFDSPIFRRLFITGIILAMLIYAVLLVSTSSVVTKVTQF